MFQRLSSPTCILLFCVASLTSLRAEVTGSILGIVRDQSAAVVANVRVVATSVETNQIHETITDATGEYRILALPVGKYTVEATAPGFQKFVTTGIELAVNQQRRVDITLQVGSVEQAVEVSATALQIETTNSQLGEVVDEKKV